MLRSESSVLTVQLLSKTFIASLLYLYRFRLPYSRTASCICHTLIGEDAAAPPLTNIRREDAEARRAEAARKKAEKDALLAAEEASLPSKAKPNPKAPKKSGRGLDLSSLDDEAKPTALNATGIDNALDALSLTSVPTNDKVDKHPERRFKAAYAAFEARRLPELEEEHRGLRRQQRIELVRKEFEKSDENPFNQVTATYDVSREELKDLRQAEREKIERRLGSP